MKRRQALQSLAIVLAPRVRAQIDKPVTIVVPYAPGGGTDALARLIARQLAPALGRPVLVENRPGAGSTLGAAHVARAAADGSTLLMATSSTLAIAPSLYPKLPYEPLTGFAPIGMIAAVPFVLVVRPALGVASVAELLALARRQPGGLAYGSAGQGSPQHLAAELFGAATGIALRHVPYAGSAAAVVDLLSGQFELMFADPSPVLPHVQAMRLRALGVTSLSRLPALLDVPPIAQAGIAELAQFEVGAWQSLVAPSGIDDDLRGLLTQALSRIVQAPSMLEPLQAIGMQVRWESSEQLAATIRSDTQRWSRLIKAARITLN
jgi:tripartite-type tricarboxylate transporter receptor subunit TctC